MRVFTYVTELSSLWLNPLLCLHFVFSFNLCNRPEVFTLVPVSKIQWRQTSPSDQEHEGLIGQPFPAPDPFTPWLGLRPPRPWPPCSPWLWPSPLILSAQPHGELPHGLPPPLLATQFYPLWLHDDVPCHDAPTCCVWPYFQQHLPKNALQLSVLWFSHTGRLRCHHSFCHLPSCCCCCSRSGCLIPPCWHQEQPPSG